MEPKAIMFVDTTTGDERMNGPIIGVLIGIAIAGVVAFIMALKQVLN